MRSVLLAVKTNSKILVKGGAELGQLNWWELKLTPNQEPDFEKPWKQLKSYWPGRNTLIEAQLQGNVSFHMFWDKQ